MTDFTPLTASVAPPDPTDPTDPIDPPDPMAPMAPMAPAAGAWGHPTAGPARRLTWRRLLVTFAVVAVASITGVVVGNAINSGTSNGDAAMAQWYAGYGTTFTGVSHDVGQVSSDVEQASTGHDSTVLAACARLRNDVATAQGDPPMPAPTLEASWSSILSDLRGAARACITGIDQQSAAELTRAGTDFDNAGEAYVQLVKRVESYR